MDVLSQRRGIGQRLQFRLLSRSQHSHSLRLILLVDRLHFLLTGLNRLRRNYGALVRDEGKRLSMMVEQILRFAGTDSGRAPYTFTPVLAETLVDRALEGSVDLLADVEVEKQVEPGLPSVMADEASLSHCLQNLLGNAVKYGDGKWVKVEALRKGDEIEFAVTDRGPGVDLLDKPNLFDAFFRGRKRSAIKFTVWVSG